MSEKTARILVRVLSVLWLVACAALFTSDAMGLYLRHASGLQVERGYPPNALVLLQAVPVGFFLVSAVMALAGFVAALGLFRFRSWSRGAVVVLSALIIACLGAQQFMMLGLEAFTTPAYVLNLGLASAPLLATMLVLTRERVRSLFRRA